MPGSPDLAFGPRLKAIFVHGCFWHGHKCKRGNRPPKSNGDYWLAKISRNRARDERVQGELAKLGWTAMTVWECETAGQEVLARRIADFLE